MAAAAASPAGASGQDLLAAIRRKDETAARHLISSGADLSVVDPTRGSTALILAAGLGLPDVCAQLVEAGADVNATNADGLTPLLAACAHEQAKCALFLAAAKGVDLNARGTDGASALDLSLRKSGSIVGNPLGSIAVELRRRGAVESKGGGCALQ